MNFSFLKHTEVRSFTNKFEFSFNFHFQNQSKMQCIWDSIHSTADEVRTTVSISPAANCRWYLRCMNNVYRRRFQLHIPRHERGMTNQLKTDYRFPFQSFASFAHSSPSRLVFNQTQIEFSFIAFKFAFNSKICQNIPPRLAGVHVASIKLKFYSISKRDLQLTFNERHIKRKKLFLLEHGIFSVELNPMYNTIVEWFHAHTIWVQKISLLWKAPRWLFHRSPLR